MKWKQKLYTLEEEIKLYDLDCPQPKKVTSVIIFFECVQILYMFSDIQVQ